MKDSFKNLTKDELLKKKEVLSKEHFDLRVQRVMSSVQNPVKLRTLRRSIARVNTRLSELEAKEALEQAKKEG